MEKDIVQIRCLSDNERYADLINGIVFGGRQVVHGEDLQAMDSQTGLWRAFPGKRVRKADKKYRDLVRKVAMGVNFTIIGVENQDKVHYLMPLRTMLYDAAEYERQAPPLRYSGGVLWKELGWEQGFAWDSGLYGYPTGVEGIYQ